MSEYIKKEDAIRAFEKSLLGKYILWDKQEIIKKDMRERISKLPTYSFTESENKGGWIPLTTRPMTDEEITEYRNCAECGEIFDCPLPDDGQEVLISVNGYTGVDTFVIDEGCYFEQADIFDVDAWQPLPEPYKKGE